MMKTQFKDSTACCTYGSKISRTMEALATSTVQERKRVRLLFYGQSITEQPWTEELVRRIGDTYPHADFSYENRSIGSFQSHRLIRTAEHDLYPYYPDLLVFHVYGDLEKHEAIIRKVRETTTAEIILTTDHMAIREGNIPGDEEHSEGVRLIAKKYDCELVEVRDAWKAYLADNHLEVQDLLKDTIHLNERGCELMADLIWPHFRYAPSYAVPHGDWIRRIPVTPADDGSITVEFSGNRVDIVADPEQPPSGSARITIDGQPPSAHPAAYTVTRPTKAQGGVWWPAIYQIGSKHPMPQLENWTLTVTEVTGEGSFNYSVTGSKTGFDGTGNSNERFVSNSKRVVIEPSDLGGILQAEKIVARMPCPVGFEVTWQVVPMFIDNYVPLKNVNPALTNSSRVTQLIENGPHTLKIIPDGSEPLSIKEIIAYEPPIKK